MAVEGAPPDGVPMLEYVAPLNALGIFNVFQ